MNEQHRKMIDEIALRWQRLIKWLAEERLAKERMELAKSK